MSIENVFDPESEEILKASTLPEHLGGIVPAGQSPAMEAFPEVVIMTFSQRILDQVAHMEGVEEIGFVMAGSKVPVYRVRIDLPPAYLASQAVAYGDAAGNEGAAPCSGDAAGSEGAAPCSGDAAESEGIAPPYFNVPRYAAVIRTGMGAPMAAAFMEEVIAKGGRKFIVFGSCGLLAGDLPPGSVIIPDKARRDEGTSYHYAPAADYIKLKNAYYLAGLLNGLEIPHVLGGIWTTDALYRETKNNAAHRRAEGCIAVDMECSALQAVCDFRGCELYQFVYAEDSLVEDNWDPRNMGCVPAEQIEGHLKLAMEIARRV